MDISRYVAFAGAEHFCFDNRFKSYRSITRNKNEYGLDSPYSLERKVQIFSNKNFLTVPSNDVTKCY